MPIILLDSSNIEAKFHNDHSTVWYFRLWVQYRQITVLQSTYVTRGVTTHPNALPRTKAPPTRKAPKWVARPGSTRAHVPIPSDPWSRDDCATNGTWQVSIFLVGDHTVLFIERTPSDVSDNISNRMFYAGSKLRLNNARYLVSEFTTCMCDNH